MSALPLRARLGTPHECLHAALARARLTASVGEARLAETLLRGVLALDPKTPGVAAELAVVLLERALDERVAGDPAAGRDELTHAGAWARWALELDPGDALARSVLARLARLGA